MTNDERIVSLQRFGYDADESRFLSLAALHSGYFVRRQFLSFVNGTKGWKDVAFIEKLRANRHATATAYRHNRMVFHLCAKPLYAALGDADNRNRRERRPLTIKSKLMSLDFVLEHLQYRYLATEREKVNYFVTTIGLAAEKLPVRWYGAQGDGMPKYFVDKFPLFIESPASGSLAGFCYIDEGQQSSQGFRTYLQQYEPILTVLPNARVIYVAAGERLLEEAKQTFVRLSRPGNMNPVDSDTRDLVAYFRIRQKVEARDFAGLDTATIVRHRDDKKRFARDSNEELYRLWQEQGDAAVLAQPGPNTAAGLYHVQFSTHVLRYDYDLFGTLVSAA